MNVQGEFHPGFYTTTVGTGYIFNAKLLALVQQLVATTLRKLFSFGRTFLKDWWSENIRLQKKRKIYEEKNPKRKYNLKIKITKKKYLRILQHHITYWYDMIFGSPTERFKRPTLRCFLELVELIFPIVWNETRLQRHAWQFGRGWYQHWIRIPKRRNERKIY